jgi:hypothetical protein
LQPEAKSRYPEKRFHCTADKRAACRAGGYGAADGYVVTG